MTSAARFVTRRRRVLELESGQEYGRLMFASIRRYRLESGSVNELMTLIDTSFTEHVQKIEGFVEYQALETGNGELITITTYHDRAGAEASTETAADWVKDTLGERFDFRRLEAFVAEVVISRARADVLEPEHY
jgi:hypothetical protein